ncbi:MAG: type II secretion system protein N [Thiolinea sp.]
MQKLKQQQLFDRVFERLPDHVTLLLIIISGFLLARLTWMMFPSDPSLIAPISTEQETQGVSVIKAHAKSTDLGKEIAGYHLLGVYKPPPPPKKAAPPKPKVAKAPAPKPKKPRPPLKLVGVYALSGKSGIAVINVKGKQQVVGLNEAIGDSGATLVKVLAESIEVSWDGEIEKLNMPNIDKTALSAIQLPASQQPQAAPQQQPIVQPASLRAPAQPSANAATQAGNAVNSGTATGAAGAIINNGTSVGGAQQPQQPTVPQNAPNAITPGAGNNAPAGSTGSAGSSAAPRLAEFRQQIMNNNINLLKVIRPSPKKENGKLVGFRIRPGTNRALFQQTGLQSGDIVTQINGMPLTSNAASMQAMQSLTSSSGATLTVVRGGQTTSVQVAF